MTGPVCRGKAANRSRDRSCSRRVGRGTLFEMIVPLHAPLLLILYSLRVRDPVSGKWVRGTRPSAA